ncbi:MAG: histidinol-phosphate transaminase [Desulfobacterales bacterium]|nr:histidinol-phosphate transaminase [Desulfobacterales bacterium]
MELKIPKHILSIKPYKPGKPIEELEREYGISDSVKLASNENPLGPAPGAVAAMQAAMDNLHRYPDGSGYYLTRKLAEKLGVQPESIVLGNGSDDVIGMLARALLEPGDEAVMTAPSFLMYEILVQSVGARPVFVPLKNLAVDLSAMLSAVTDRTRIVFINNPNNPTGSFIRQAEFLAFLEKLPPSVTVVLDEAYIEFARDPECLNGLSVMGETPPVAVLRTFSKIYGLAGVRIGYGVMPPELAGLLHRVRQPFNASSLAQAAAVGALDDDPFVQKTIELVATELDFLQTALKEMKIPSFPTQANFFLVDVKEDADRVFQEMLKEGVIIRSMVSYGYPQYIRVNVGTRKENERFLAAFKKVMHRLAEDKNV